MKSPRSIILLDVVWLYNCLTLVTMSDMGILIKWDIQTLEMHNYTIEYNAPLINVTLAACPHKNNLIAIGCQNGDFIVYDFTGKKFFFFLN